MSEDKDFFDDVDYYLTLERSVREVGPPFFNAMAAFFAQKRLSELDPFDSPGLYLLCLTAFEDTLEKAEPALPDRVYRKAKKGLDASMAIWESSRMEEDARRILSTESERLKEQFREELRAFLADKGFTDGQA